MLDETTNRGARLALEKSGDSRSGEVYRPGDIFDGQLSGETRIDELNHLFDLWQHHYSPSKKPEKVLQSGSRGLADGLLRRIGRRREWRRALDLEPTLTPVSLTCV